MFEKQEAESGTRAASTEFLRDWLTGRVAEFVELPREEISSAVPLGEYGLDSVSAISVCADIEDHFGMVVEPTLLWDHPTIDALTAVLIEEQERTEEQGPSA